MNGNDVRVAMSNRPAGIAFDCYGTLLRLPRGLDVTRRYGRLAGGVAGPSPMTRNMPLEEALAARGIDAETAGAIGADAIAEAAGAEPMAGVMDALARLRNASIPFVIVSNLSREYAGPIARWFPGVPTVLSFEMGAAKPSPAMYEAARARLGVEGRMLMVGDSRRCDHDGARAAGFDAVLLSPTDVEGAVCARDVAEVVARMV
jgi:HAD superfamily hydrolase (TIGR01549 family)